MPEDMRYHFRLRCGLLPLLLLEGSFELRKVCRMQNPLEVWHQWREQGIYQLQIACAVQGGKQGRGCMEVPVCFPGTDMGDIEVGEFLCVRQDARIHQLKVQLCVCSPLAEQSFEYVLSQLGIRFLPGLC